MADPLRQVLEPFDRAIVFGLSHDQAGWIGWSGILTAPTVPTSLFGPCGHRGQVARK
jgi:hypothetical protein